MECQHERTTTHEIDFGTFKIYYREICDKCHKVLGETSRDKTKEEIEEQDNKRKGMSNG
jgi:hypothetical protein